MNNTPPYDPPRIDTKALDSFIRAVDHALKGKYGHGEPRNVDPKVIEASMKGYREQLEEQGQQERARRLSFWYTFPPLNRILRFRDRIRLRLYNREWVKNNIH